MGTCLDQANMIQSTREYKHYINKKHSRTRIPLHLESFHFGLKCWGISILVVVNLFIREKLYML